MLYYSENLHTNSKDYLSCSSLKPNNPSLIFPHEDAECWCLLCAGLLRINGVTKVCSELIAGASFDPSLLSSVFCWKMFEESLAQF